MFINQRNYNDYTIEINPLDIKMLIFYLPIVLLLPNCNSGKVVNLNAPVLIKDIEINIDIKCFPFSYLKEQM